MNVDLLMTLCAGDDQIPRTGPCLPLSLAGLFVRHRNVYSDEIYLLCHGSDSLRTSINIHIPYKISTIATLTPER